MKKKSLDIRYGNMKRLYANILRGALILSFVASVNAQTPPSPRVRPPRNTPPVATVSDDSAADAEINVKNAELAAVVRIFSRKTKRNYILDERVKGKVTIYLPGKLSPEDSQKILDSILALKGFTTVPVGENLWKIIPSKEAKQSTIPTLGSEEAQGGEKRAAVVTKLINPKFVSAEDLQKLLTQLVSPDGLINAYTGTNSLVLIDYEDNIERIRKIIAELDVPSTDRDMTIIPITHADAKDIADKLKQILGLGGEGKQGSTASSGDSAADLLNARFREITGAPPTNRGQPAAAVAQAEGGKVVSALAREPKIIADERTNSIVVVADEDTTARLRALISQLDSKLDLSGFRFYVYRCQHANATELASVLSGIATGQSSSSGTSSGGNNRGLSSGTGFDDDSGLGTGTGFGSGSTSRNGRNNRSDFGSNSSRMGGLTSTRTRSKDGQQRTAQTVQFGEGISITADPATNSLIINASKADWEKVKSLLEKLDVKRRQVLVEAVLLEVSVDENEGLDTSFLTSTGGVDGGVLAKSDFGANNLGTLFSDPTKLSNFSMAAASAGSLKIGDKITLPTQTILLNAIKSNSNVNVLSAPNILTTDNEEAQIIVGQNVPFLTSISNSPELNNTTQQVDRQDVGITLRITPQISSGDFVTLRIFTEVSNVIAETLASRLGPTTTKRTSETTVITKDSQMIVTGGLISDNSNSSDNGVPYLKDIPVLGHAFRNWSESRSRKNLLIFITPRIVQDQFDARDATVVRRNDMEHVIQNGDVYPDRQEVLRNIDIDRVTEASKYEGEGPGTIRAPDEAAIEVKRLAPTTTTTTTTDMEVKISPKLPGQASRISPPLMDNHAASYLLLKSNGAVPSGLPFKGEKGVVGIVIPSDSANLARRFFKNGGSYRYATSGKEIKLSVVGSFGSPEEAAQAGATGAWYTLSPYEIMNLGSGPWYAG